MHHSFSSLATDGSEVARHVHEPDSDNPSGAADLYVEEHFIPGVDLLKTVENIIP